METNASRDQFNKQAALYATSPVHRSGPSLPVLVEMAAPKPVDLVLDVATGTGNTALALAPLVLRVIGLDVASAMLDQARGRAQAEKIQNIEFVAGSAEEIPFPDAEFSLVVSRHAPHHFHRLDRFLSEVRRVLKPGGSFVVADQISPSAEIADWVDRWERRRDPSHFRQRTVAEWKEMATVAGFSWIQDQAVPYELPFDWWVKQAGCAEQTVQELQEQASSADEVVQREMGIKFNPSGGVLSFMEPMMVARLER
ncbi:MAG: methyltransferase domain-containing protein [Verrucomicrobia bacterium]|nr:methyltransferase domain-containing protein [Verrucomicrobiota bacterium]MBV8486577.1 methyltransferase domain-containing protein [Verrucomicrobiota bacterium]